GVLAGADPGLDFDLYVYPQCQLAAADCGAHRKTIVEIALVHLVETGEMLHVGQPDRGLDHLIDPHTALGQGFADTAHDRLGLLADIPEHHVALWVHWYLPREKQEIADTDGLGERVGQMAGVTLQLFGHGI